MKVLISKNNNVFVELSKLQSFDTIVNELDILEIRRKYLIVKNDVQALWFIFFNSLL